MLGTAAVQLDLASCVAPLLTLALLGAWAILSIRRHWNR